MGEKRAKKRLKKGSKQNLRSSPKKAKAAGPQPAKKRAKVKELSPKRIQTCQKLTSEPCDLRGSYGETRIALLPVEPYLIHAYWEVTPDELNKARQCLGEDKAEAQPVLRFYDVTDAAVDRTNARDYFDVDVDIDAKDSCVRLKSPDRSYFVEFGIKADDGRFQPITRSSVAQTPPAEPAQRADEQFMLVEGDYDRLKTVPPPPVASQGELSDYGGEFALKPERGDAHHKKGGKLDLTEMNEKEFVLGVSSK